jgi:hypothetical protein
MDWQSYKGCLEEVAKIAPAFTAIFAAVAVGVAWWSLAAQKRVARRRAAIDFFLKTEMDKEMLEAHQRYLDAVKVLKAEPDVRRFVDCKKHYNAARSYLNVHELIAVGVLQKVFDNSVSRSYWHAEFDRAYTGCNRLLLHLGGDRTYSEMVKLQLKWKRGY